MRRVAVIRRQHAVQLCIRCDGHGLDAVLHSPAITDVGIAEGDLLPGLRHRACTGRITQHGRRHTGFSRVVRAAAAAAGRSA